MLQNLAWQPIDPLTHAQLSMFHALGDQIRLSNDDRRRALNLDDKTWSKWMDFLLDGPLPAQPPASEMLRRLGEVSLNLTLVAARTAECVPTDR